MTKSKWQLFVGTTESLPVSRIVEVDMPKRNLFVEEMSDGTFRVTYSKTLGLTADGSTMRLERSTGVREEYEAAMVREAYKRGIADGQRTEREAIAARMTWRPETEAGDIREGVHWQASLTLTLDETNAPRRADARVHDDEWVHVEQESVRVEVADGDGGGKMVDAVEWAWFAALTECRGSNCAFDTYEEAVADLTTFLQAHGVRLERQRR